MRHMLVVVVLMLLAVGAFAQDYVEVEIDGMGATSIALNFTHDFGDGFGAFVLMQDTRGWSQFYAGPTFSPCPEVQIGIGLGAESGSHEVRKGGFLWAEQGKLSLLSFFEDGGSGSWHWHRLMYQADDDWSVGLSDRTGYGEGVVLERSLGSSNIQLAGYRNTLIATWHHSF